jgi:GH24 family phage-related lysozyme (muramidase)
MTLKSSQDAINLIVAEEDSDEAYYNKFYLHFDWPKGASGPTVGIGYDCGYSTAAEIKSDWTGFVSDATVSALMHAAGIKGNAAGSWVARNRSSVTITWEQALEQFKGKEMVDWESQVQHALANTDLLSGDSFGALVSLAYNRGAGGFHSPGSRFLEMRAITSLMVSKQFDKIPNEFLAMRRLWPVGGDLWKRRAAEAKLFSQGLAKTGVS